MKRHSLGERERKCYVASEETFVGTSIKQEPQVDELIVSSSNELPSDVDVVRQAYSRGNIGFDIRLLNASGNLPVQGGTVNLQDDKSLLYNQKSEMNMPSSVLTQKPVIHDNLESADMRLNVRPSHLELGRSREGIFLHTDAVDVKPNLLTVPVSSAHYCPDTLSNIKTETTSDTCQLYAADNMTHPLLRTMQTGNQDAKRICFRALTGFTVGPVANFSTEGKSVDRRLRNKATVVLKRLTTAELSVWNVDLSAVSRTSDVSDASQKNVVEPILVNEMSGSSVIQRKDCEAESDYSLSGPESSCSEYVRPRTNRSFVKTFSNRRTLLVMRLDSSGKYYLSKMNKNLLTLSHSDSASNETDDPDNESPVSNVMHCGHQGSTEVENPETVLTDCKAETSRILNLRTKNGSDSTGLTAEDPKPNAPSKYFENTSDVELKLDNGDHGSSLGYRAQVSSSHDSRYHRTASVLSAYLGPKDISISRGMSREHLKRKAKPVCFQNIDETDDKPESYSEWTETSDSDDVISLNTGELPDDKSESGCERTKTSDSDGVHSLNKKGLLDGCLANEDVPISPAIAARLLEKVHHALRMARLKSQSLPKWNVGNGFGSIKEQEISFFENVRLAQKANYKCSQKAVNIPKIKCILCTSLFQSLINLTGHMARSHRTTLEQPYRCEQCKNLYSSVKQLNNHVECVHQSRVWCKLCGLSFKNSKKLEYHRCTIHKPVFSCATCGDSFSTSLDTRKHVAKTNHTANNKCDQCCVIARSAADLQKHKEERHGKEENHLQCTLCDFVCVSCTHMFKHYLTHPGVESNVCMYCNKKFPKLLGVKNHLLRKHGVKRWVCPICAKCHSHKHRLEAHMATHSEKIHLCGVCGRKFAAERYLRIHERRWHSGVKGEHLCAVCGACHPSRSALKIHLATHSEKKIQCSLCNKKFSLQVYLDNHMNNVHCDDPSIKKFLCDLCGRRFLTTSHLDTHRLIHTNETPYKCQNCGKKFKRPHNLSSHMRTHTEERRFPCDICGDRFKWKHNMENHRKIHNVKTKI